MTTYPASPVPDTNPPTHERIRIERWTDYLNEGGLTNGELGYRFLEAYTAGFKRADIAVMVGRSPGYVSSLASLVRKVGTGRVS